MKKIVLTLIAIMAAFTVQAQKCSTMWPYLYPEFREGTIYMQGGQKVLQQINVHTLKGRLHFVDNGVVKEAVSDEVLLLQIGEDKYMCVNSDIMKVVASEERGFIAAHITGDFQKLNNTGGAYGTSTTNSATQKLTSIDVAGKVNQNHMEMWENRQNGELVDLVTKYYLVTPELTVAATRKDVEDTLPPERKSEFKTWLKSNKIKWNDPQSLMSLMDFLCK